MHVSHPSLEFTSINMKREVELQAHTAYAEPSAIDEAWRSVKSRSDFNRQLALRSECRTLAVCMWTIALAMSIAVSTIAETHSWPVR